MDSRMLQYVRYIMVLAGTLPCSLINSHKLLYTFHKYLVQAGLIMGLIFMYGVLPTIHESIESLPKTITDMIIYTTVYIKGLVCMTKSMGQLISDLIAYEDRLLQSGNKKILDVYEELVKKSKLIQVFYILTMYSTFVSFVVPHYINYMYHKQGSGIKMNSTLHIPKSTPYNWWLPFDDEKYYLASLLLQTYCPLLATNFYCFVEIILVILPLNIILKLKVLRVNLMSINNISVDDEEEMNTVDKLMASCITEHIDIMKNCTFLNATVKYIMLLEFLLTSLQLSLALFQIISANQSGIIIFSAVYVFQTLVQVLILYWYANEIRRESVAIADTVYELPWYKYNRRINTNIQIMMLRSQKPLCLTVGPFGDMTLEMAVKIIKGVYTYITFMQQTYGKK